MEYGLNGHHGVLAPSLVTVDYNNVTENVETLPLLVMVLIVSLMFLVYELNLTWKIKHAILMSVIVS